MKDIKGAQIELKDLIALRHLAFALNFKMTQNVDSYGSGSYTAKHHSRGLEFSDVRVYQPGDEIRNMDWRITARTGKPHTKLYHPETELQVYLLIDYSPSMFFGTRVAFKSVVAAEVAALIAWSAILQNHHVGGMIFGKDKLITFNPQNRQENLIVMLRALSEGTATSRSPDKKNYLEETLHRVDMLARPGSVIFLLSDFYFLHEDTEKYLYQLTQQHTVYTGFFYDVLEAIPPAPDIYTISNGNVFASMDTRNPYFCEAYRKNFRARYENLNNIMKRYKIPLLNFRTDKNPTPVLSKAFQGKVFVENSII